MEKKSAVKNSIILSGLVGTGGLFVAKLLGLVYSIPFSSILGSEAYMGYYGQAYNIYSYVLNVFTAGFPFAVATLVARYTVLKDAKTVLLVKKISISFLAVTGFVGMILLMASAGFLAPLMVEEDPQIMANVIRILSVAIFLVPVLSAFRGFYQGLKEMEEYAFSQAFEQLFRVGFLLGMACLIVYAFGWERKWALYASVLSTSVAAIAGIVQIFHFDRVHSAPIKEQAMVQTDAAVPAKKLLREFFFLAIPYLIVAILGYSDSIYNAVLLPSGLRLHNYASEQITTIISATTYVGVKLTAIPMILAPGFTAALIPHISSALAQKNIKLAKKNVLDCLNIIFYIALPISFCIFAYAQPLFFTLFHNEDLDLCTYVTQWLAIEGFFGTLTPVVTNIMMALELKRNVLKRLLVCTLIKGLTMVPLVWILGFPGAVISSTLGYLYLLYYNFKEIHKVYGIDYRKLSIIVIRVCIGIIGLWIASLILTWIGLGGIEGGKLVSFIKMACNGLLSVGVYFMITAYLKVPQSVFHVSFSQVLNKLKRRGE